MIEQMETRVVELFKSNESEKARQAVARMEAALKDLMDQVKGYHKNLSYALDMQAEIDNAARELEELHEWLRIGRTPEEQRQMRRM